MIMSHHHGKRLRATRSYSPPHALTLGKQRHILPVVLEHLILQYCNTGDLGELALCSRSCRQWVHLWLHQTPKFVCDFYSPADALVLNLLATRPRAQTASGRRLSQFHLQLLKAAASTRGWDKLQLLLLRIIDQHEATLQVFHCEKLPTEWQRSITTRLASCSALRDFDLDVDDHDGAICRRLMDNDNLRKLNWSSAAAPGIIIPFLKRRFPHLRELHSGNAAPLDADTLQCLIKLAPHSILEHLEVSQQSDASDIESLLQLFAALPSLKNLVFELGLVDVDDLPVERQVHLPVLEHYMNETDEVEIMEKIVFHMPMLQTFVSSVLTVPQLTQLMRGSPRLTKLSADHHESDPAEISRVLAEPGAWPHLQELTLWGSICLDSPMLLALARWTELQELSLVLLRGTLPVVVDIARDLLLPLPRLTELHVVYECSTTRDVPRSFDYTNRTRGPVFRHGLRCLKLSVGDDGLFRQCTFPELVSLTLNGVGAVFETLPVLAPLPKLKNLWLDHLHHLDEASLAAFVRQHARLRLEYVDVENCLNSHGQPLSSSFLDLLSKRLLPSLITVRFWTSAKGLQPDSLVRLIDASPNLGGLYLPGPILEDEVIRRVVPISCHGRLCPRCCPRQPLVVTCGYDRLAVDCGS